MSTPRTPADTPGRAGSRWPRWTVLGATGVALTAAVTALASGLTPVAPPPAASAAGLRAFADCTELRDWYVAEALPHVGPYGLDGGYAVPFAAMESAGGTLDRASGADGSAAATPGESLGSSATGTNVQEAGVDEPDLAKTDGSLVVRVERDTTGGDLTTEPGVDRVAVPSRLVLVVTDVSGSTPRDVARLTLPDGLLSAEILLVGDTVLVVGQDAVFADPGGWEPLGDRRGMDLLPVSPAGQRSRLVTVSLADPAAPEVTSDQRLDGRVVSARQYGDVVRVVLSTDSPALAFVQPARGRDAAEAERENRRIVRESTVADWLPRRSLAGGGTDSLVACEDVRHPATGAGYGTLTVLTLRAEDPTSLASTAVTASGEVVYSSTDRLYVATGSWWSVAMPLAELAVEGDASLPGTPLPERPLTGTPLPVDPFPPVEPPGGPRPVEPLPVEPEQPTTQLHAFALDGADTAYLASGEVSGTVADRWRLDEHEGVLRVAVAFPWGRTGGSDNGVVTLRESGDRLVQVGGVRGLGPGEEIKAVRWFDDLAVVVTFRQIDPLYGVDLTDPARPRVLGELKIPGFSQYLHPIGGDRLLGLGLDATLEGRVLGGQAAVFDLGEPSDPRRLATLLFGREVVPSTGWEPRTLTWLTAGAGSGTAWVEVVDQRTGATVMQEVLVGADGSLRLGRSVDTGRWSEGSGRALPVSGDRVAVVGETVTLVAAG